MIITVFFEGGANPTSNPNADTVDNTIALREAFNTLLNNGIENKNIRIIAHPAYSISNAVKQRSSDSLLLIDLDGKKELKGKRIDDNKLKDIEDCIFFMVQRMEAWILSQPDIIEEYLTANYSKETTTHLYKDEAIFGKNPETITRPDDVLNTLIQRHFFIMKLGKKKKLKYGKLKLAPGLIENLDINALKETFEDVKGLLLKVESLFPKDEDSLPDVLTSGSIVKRNI